MCGRLPPAEEVDGGSLNVLVKYNNYFPVMNKKRNLCNIPDILDDPCPLTAGIHEATLVQKFPSYAPSVSDEGLSLCSHSSACSLHTMTLC